MNIPEEVIEVAHSLPNPTARGLFYAASIEYLQNGAEPDYKMGREAHSLFVMCKPVLDFYKSHEM